MEEQGEGLLPAETDRNGVNDGPNQEQVERPEIAPLSGAVGNGDVVFVQPESEGKSGDNLDVDLEPDQQVKPVGKSLSKPVGKLPKSASVRTLADAPAFVGKPVGNSLPKPVGNPVGISVGKQELSQQKQQVSRTEWFRHELDFRQNKKGGAWVLIRRRLRWSDTRYSKQVVKRFCPQLSKKMIEQISVGKFSPEAIAALQNGGIQHGFISALQERIGKGNGKRRTELTDFERSLLARIESGVRASNRGGND